MSRHREYWTMRKVEHDPLCPFLSPDSGPPICPWCYVIAKVRDEYECKQLTDTEVSQAAYRAGKRDMLDECLAEVDGLVPYEGVRAQRVLAMVSYHLRDMRGMK